MPKITISKIVIVKREEFATLKTELSELTKKYQTKKSELYNSILTDYNFELRSNVTPLKPGYTKRDKKDYNALKQAFTKGYYQILNSELIILDEERALQNIVDNCENVSLKNLFDLDYGFDQVMVTIIDNLHKFKSNAKIKNCTLKVDSSEAYFKALRKALKRANKREEIKTLQNAIEIKRELNKLSYIQLLQISKTAKILANHKIAIMS